MVFVCEAKKSKKRSKTKTVSAPEKTGDPWTGVDVVVLLLLLVESYARRTGKCVNCDLRLLILRTFVRPLLEGGDISKIATELFNAPFCLLAHDFGVDDARYTYANRAALSMMSASWDDVVGSPATLFDKATMDKAADAGMGPECPALSTV